jgi:predicted Zn-ribbon and HTH transcriptional regulator
MEPVTLKASKGWANCGKKAIPGYPPVKCERCGHQWNVRTKPEERKSKMRCPKCKAYLEVEPIKEKD